MQHSVNSAFICFYPKWNLTYLILSIHKWNIFEILKGIKSVGIIQQLERSFSKFSKSKFKSFSSFSYFCCLFCFVLWNTVRVWNPNRYGFRTLNNCSVSKKFGFQTQFCWVYIWNLNFLFGFQHFWVMSAVQTLVFRFQTTYMSQNRSWKSSDFRA